MEVGQMTEFNNSFRNSQFTWPDNYYMETDAKKREGLLKAQLETDHSEENQVRYQIWTKRYTIPKKGVTGADYYMRMLIHMELLYEKKNSFFGKKSYQKGLAEIRDVFCLDLLKEKPELANLWKEEFVHLWTLYISSCKDDNNYNGILLGLGKMSKDRLESKIKNDVEHKAVVIPEELGLAEELTLFRQAAWEAYHRLVG